MKQRNSSIEILRMIAVWGIIMMHCYTLIDPAASTPFNHYLGYAINAVCNTGVSCFVLISGYFGVRYDKGKFIRLVWQTTLYAVIVAAMIYGFTAPTFKALLSVPCYSFWFIACYMLLMLTAPYIETMLKGTSQQELRRLLLILFVVFSILPTLTMGHSSDSIISAGGKCFTYFVFLYLVGRYIRLYHDRDYSSYRTLAVFLACTLLIFALNVSASLFTGKKIINFSLDCSPLILVSSISLFFFFKSHVFHSSFINKAAGSVLAIYVMNGSYLFFDRELIHLTTYSGSCAFGLWLMLLSVITFGFGLLVDQLLHLILKRK